jgi:hypothetical protein
MLFATVLTTYTIMKKNIFFTTQGKPKEFATLAFTNHEIYWFRSKLNIEALGFKNWETPEGLNSIPAGPVGQSLRTTFLIAQSITGDHININPHTVRKYPQVWYYSSVCQR